MIEKTNKGLEQQKQKSENHFLSPAVPLIKKNKLWRFKPKNFVSTGLCDNFMARANFILDFEFNIIREVR